MGAIKEFYHDEICMMFHEERDLFLDQEIADKIEAKNRILEERAAAVEEKAERANFENIYSLTGTYPI